MSKNNEPIIPAKVRQPRKISPFWLLPVIAFIIGGLLFFQILSEQGERIKIRFQEGDGISAGKTLIRYQGLQIGQVKRVYFVDEMKSVEVEAEINPEAKSILKEGTKFWLVKPTASLAGVSGLDALVSGNYITLQPDENAQENRSQYEFIAENDPPAITVTDGDLLVRLIADDLGSISVGASVYFRKVPVGNIANYRFTGDQKKVEIDLVIDSKYANLVKQDSRFWNISGLSAEFNLNNGIRLNMDSLASVVKGAVAFDSPEQSAVAEQGQQFPLYGNLQQAKRGQTVQVLLPIMPNLKVNETGVYYENIQIGLLTHLQMPNDGQNDVPKGMLKGTLLIDPNHTQLLKSETQILLKEPHFNLNIDQLSKMSELFRGVYFDIQAGGGKPQYQFTVQKETDYLLSRPNILALNLNAPQSYGVDKGQGIYYNDVQIGEILKRTLSLDDVSFQAVIFPSYRHLINAETKFVAISHLDISLGADGIRVQAASPKSWLKGGVRILPAKSNQTAKSTYALYKDLESAENGITEHEKKTSLTLNATELAGIEQGSVLLYRQFKIGEVLKIRPQSKAFNVEIYVVPAYRHLITEKNRFWVESAAKVDLSANGLTLEAAPLMRVLKGAIGMDNNGVKESKTLYSSYEKATSSGTYLTLTAKDGSKLSRGMPVKYMGLKVGQLDKLELDYAKKQVKATAYIEGQYYPLLAKAGSQFQVVSMQVDTTGIKNIDTLLQNYINVEIGSGQAQTQFQLQDTESTATQYGNGFPVIVETTDANGITPDAPVLYRGMQVGIVQKLNLSELGDRVFIQLKIEPKYQHLVRKNSEFWATSGYTMDISLSGASISSGTMSQLLNGGISFSTPSSKVVQPQAEANRHFRLQRKMPEGALGWDQGVAE